MMTGWMAASPGGTPAAPRRAGQVRNSLVPALHPKKERKKSRSVSASDRIVIPDSHCPTPWNSRSREAVAEEPRAVAAQKDRPRRRRGHRHAGLQDLRRDMECRWPRAAGLPQPRRLAPHLAAGRHLRPRVRRPDSSVTFFSSFLFFSCVVFCIIRGD